MTSQLVVTLNPILALQYSRPELILKRTLSGMGVCRCTSSHFLLQLRPSATANHSKPVATLPSLLAKDGTR